MLQQLVTSTLADCYTCRLMLLLLSLTSHHLPVAHGAAPSRSRLQIRSAIDSRSMMERYLTVTIDRHGRAGRTSASSSVLSTLSHPHGGDHDDDIMHLALSRSRHSVDCSGLMTSSTSTKTSRSTSRLHLGVPSDLRRSSLQTDRHHHTPRPPRHQYSQTDSTCDGGGCAQSSGSHSSVALTDDEAGSTRRVSYGGGTTAPIRSVNTMSAAAPRDTTIFDIGADLIKVVIHIR